MSNPYAVRKDYAFWKRSMSQRPACEVDPVTHVPFTIMRSDKVATAGSCFAQHISRTLTDLGFTYLVTEKAPAIGATGNEGYGVFPARFANIYTTRQLLQLFDRAYGLFDPVDAAWQTNDGRYLDPFRPRIQEGGFATVDALMSDREHHLAAVREMFEACDVFIFTLGLTEGWMSARDGAMFPLAPGVVAQNVTPSLYTFINFSVAEVEADLISVIDKIRTVNPRVRIILTVSPVALIATYEDRHVLLSTTYSKSVLRVAAETASRVRMEVAYFPSYEIISGPHARGSYFEDDLREVRPDAVAHVMEIFARHYLSETSWQVESVDSAPTIAPIAARPNEVDAIRELERTVCDEEIIDPTR